MRMDSEVLFYPYVIHMSLATLCCAKHMVAHVTCCM
jgi:hypothetical protein